MEISSSGLHHFASAKTSGSGAAPSVAGALSTLHNRRVVRRSHFVSVRNIRRLLNVCVRLFRVSSVRSVCLRKHWSPAPLDQRYTVHIQFLDDRVDRFEALERLWQQQQNIVLQHQGFSHAL